LTYALIGLFVCLSILPEVKTDLYWFVSAICYKLPMVLLLFLAGLFLRLRDRFSWPDLILSLVLLVVILGSNELVTLVVGTMLLMGVLIMSGKSSAALKSLRWPILLLTVVCMAVVFLAGFSTKRSSELPSPTVAATLTAFPAFFGMSIWNVFRSSLACFFLLDILVFFSGQKKGFLPPAFPARRMAIAFSAILPISFLAMVHVTHGSIPLRVLNVFVVFLFACLVCWSAEFAMSGKIDRDPRLVQVFNRHKFIVYALLLCCSTLSADILQSLYTGYYARKANTIRLEAIGSARAAGEHVAVLQPYEKLVDSLMSPGSRVLVRRMAGRRPVLLSMDADLPGEETLRFLCHFHGVDTIRVGTRNYPAFKPYRNGEAK
jgi:hypothetical protein